MSPSLSLRLIPGVQGPDGIPVLQTTSNSGFLGPVTGLFMSALVPMAHKNSHSITDDEYYNGVSTDQHHSVSDLLLEYHLHLTRMAPSSQFCSPFQIRCKFQQHIKSNAVANGWAWTGVPFTNTCLAHGYNRWGLPSCCCCSCGIDSSPTLALPASDRLDSYTASLVVSPFVPLTSGTDTSDARAQTAEAGAVTEKLRSPVENGTPQASAPDSGSSSHSPVTSETHAQMAALQARIRDLDGINQRQHTHTLLEATHSNQYLTVSCRIAPSRTEAEPSKITPVNMACAWRGIVNDGNPNPLHR
ncbi:hypothetical protein B0H13DRAFT_1871235 [Mycena leptocephala]|nr:hypothetical protein B0H13DRAFT_1871235 [Mycena leptocephala]